MGVLSSHFTPVVDTGRTRYPTRYPTFPVANARLLLPTTSKCSRAIREANDFMKN